MRITLERMNKAVHMKATNEEGAVIQVDGAVSVGGENKGFRPMQLLLAGLGSCSSIDIISILKKQKQPIEDLTVWVDGEREKDKVPSLFKNIHVHFLLRGNLDEKKVKRAVDLSMKTYCSVTKTLEKTAKITYSFEIV
jgi:putative redox protein